MAMNFVVEETDLVVDGVLCVSYEPTHLYLKDRETDFQALIDAGRPGRVTIHGFCEKVSKKPHLQAVINRLLVQDFKYTPEVQELLDLYMPNLSPMAELNLDIPNMHVVHEICAHGPHLPWLHWTRYAEFALKIYFRYEMHGFLQYVCETLRDRSLLEPVAEVGQGWHQVSIGDFLVVADSYDQLRGAQMMFRVVPDNSRLFLSEARFGVTRSGNPAKCYHDRVLKSSPLRPQPQVPQVPVSTEVSDTDMILLWFLDPLN